MESFRERASMAAGVLLLIVGLGLVYVVISLGRYIPLWVVGQSANAEVLDLWFEQIGEAGDEDRKELYYDYFVRYRFTTPPGETITRTAKISASEWFELGEGGYVRVIYIPSDPANSQLDNRRFLPLFTVCYIPVIIMTGVCLVVGWHLAQPIIVELKKMRGG
jgi:hypothetical protein